MTYRDQILKCKDAEEINNLIHELLHAESEALRQAVDANQLSADVKRLIDERAIAIKSGGIDYLRCYGAEAPKFMPGTVISINQGISPEKN
jgi:hypothetical protein